MDDFKKNDIISNVIIRLHYVILIAMTLIVLYFDNTNWFFVLLGFDAVYIAAFEIYLYKRRKNSKEVSREIISLLNSPLRKRLVDFPMALMLSDSNGNIIWKSEKLIDLFGDNNCYKLRSIFDISPDFDIEKLFHFEFNNKHFEVYTDTDVQKESKLYIHYVLECTDYYILQKKHEDIQPIVAHVIIDNYDELFDTSMREVEKSQIRTQIYDSIQAWAAKTNGLLLRNERDSFIYIFNNALLADLEKQQFDILETVKKLELNVKTYPTLSIGIGIGGDSYQGNNDYAREATNMAISRGGDQVVIKKGKNYEFFGGHSKATEKSIKIKARVVASALGEIFKEVNNVYIMGHSFPDFDALGACVGFYRIAASYGKKAYIVLDQKTNLSERLFDRIKATSDYDSIFISPDSAFDNLDPSGLTVVVDTHRPGYVVEPRLIGKTKHCIVIDHHRKSVDFINDTDIFYHDPAASSACEMVASLIQYTPNCDLTKTEAEALLAGIYLDTKFYTIRTSPTTFEASVFLKKAGANTVNVKMLFQTDVDTYKNKIKLVNNAEIYRKIMAIAVWKDDVSDSSEMKIVSAQAADEMLNIDNVYASFTLFTLENGMVNISARSLGVINVQLIMEELGGGGHQTMSGVQMNCTMDESVEKLKAAIDNYLNVVNLKDRINNNGRE